MLVVLLAEHGHARLHTGKQLHHDSADADKKTGAKVTLQDVGQVSGRLHLVGLRLGVELFLIGCEQQLATGRLQLGAIRFPGPRVGVKVLMRQKLQAVDKDAGDRDIAARSGLAYQCQMAVVQVAHSGHKSGPLEWGQLLAQFGDGVDDFHSSLVGQTVA